MKKKKLIIILIVTIVLIAICIGLVVLFNKGENLNTGVNNNDTPNVQQVQVTGKLKKYIESLGNNYYIKYYGKFKNVKEELQQAVVEYTLKNNDFAMRSQEIDMRIVCTGDVLSTISDRYKIIVDISKNSFDTTEYNLASDFGQTFVKSAKEKLNKIEYDVEEYKYYDNNIKYYFLEDNLKFIMYNEEQIKILRLEYKTNSEMFTIPGNYEKLIA